MNLVQSLAYGIEIIEHVDIDKQFKFVLSKSAEENRTIAATSDIAEALYLCDVTEAGYSFCDTATTFDVSYKGRPVYQNIYISELEDYIENLILKDLCKTLKVNKKRLKAYRQKAKAV